MKPYAQGLWQYRHFIFSSIKTDFRSRFVRSKISAAWVILQPMIQAAIYAVILSSVLAAKLPGVSSSYGYAVYLLAGMAIWGLFAEILSRGLNVFIDNANVLKKIVFPRICLPAITLGISVANFALFLLATLVVLALIDMWPGMALVYLIPLIALTCALGLGLGLFLGTLNVFMRDVGQVMGVVLQLWFWFTPIVYPRSILPDALKPWLNLNPMAPIVDGVQQVLVYGQAPAWPDLLGVSLLSLFLLAISFIAFRRAVPEMADVL